VVTEEELVGIWVTDPIHGTRLAAAIRHYEVHGAELGAEDLDQYVRKAVAFSQEAKKRNGLGKIVGGLIPNVRRWKKLGKYIDVATNGEVVSFGRDYAADNIK